MLRKYQIILLMPCTADVPDHTAQSMCCGNARLYCSDHVLQKCHRLLRSCSPDVPDHTAKTMCSGNARSYCSSNCTRMNETYITMVRFHSRYKKSLEIKYINTNDSNKSKIALTPQSTSQYHKNTYTLTTRTPS